MDMGFITWLIILPCFNTIRVSSHEGYFSHASDAELDPRFAFHHDADQEAVMAVMLMAVMMVETHRLRFIASSAFLSASVSSHGWSFSHALTVFALHHMAGHSAMLQ